MMILSGLVNANARHSLLHSLKGLNIIKQYDIIIFHDSLFNISYCHYNQKEILENNYKTHLGLNCLGFDWFVTRLPLTWLVVFNARVTWGFTALLGPYSQSICQWDMRSQLFNFNIMPQCTSLPFVVSTIKIRDAKYTKDKGLALIRHWVGSVM